MRAHEGQTDKAGQPYILHPLRIASKFTYDPVMYAGAVLHDVVEDTFSKPNQITLEDIHLEVSFEVMEIVMALTRLEKGMTYFRADGETLTYEKEKEPYLPEFIPRCAAHPKAKLLKSEDIYDNLDPKRMAILTLDELGRVLRYHKALKILGA